MIILTILTTSLTHFSLKGWENVLFEIGSEGLILISREPRSGPKDWPRFAGSESIPPKLSKTLSVFLTTRLSVFLGSGIGYSANAQLKNGFRKRLSACPGVFVLFGSALAPVHRVYVREQTFTQGAYVVRNADG